MPAEEVHQLYSKLDVEYEYPNDSTTEFYPFTQLDTIITNRLFTPDNNSVPEDLQIRVSKDVKFFVGATNEGAETEDYSLKISENDDDTAVINSRRQNLNLSADFLNMNSLIINNNAGAVKAYTDKVLQIESDVKIEMSGKTEFLNEVRMDKNIYVGKSIIFYNSDDAKSAITDEELAALSQTQIRIGLQYNTAKDTLDIVKQIGSGSGIQKKLMARLGQGGLVGSSDPSLQNVPYYEDPSVTNSPYNPSAPVFDAVNIWKQYNKTLYYAAKPGDEKIGIGTSNVSGIFEVQGDTKINEVLLTTDNNLSGIRSLTATSNISTSNITVSGIANFDGETILSNVELTTINFAKNATVSSFDGNLSSLSNDLAPWLNNDQNEVLSSGFSNDSGFISKLQEVVIDTKWRFKEDGEELRIEKLKEDGTWEEKFKLS